jgi:hypothetical protein
MTDLQPAEAALRVQGHVKTITGFVTAYTDLHPDALTLPDAINWFIAHSTDLQAESPEVITEVRRQVAEKVNPS